MSVPAALNVKRIGIDATTWWNDRGFGRFTRELVRALAARDSGFEYTLFVDRTSHAVDASSVDSPDPQPLPENVDVRVVETRSTLNEHAVGSRSRSPLDMFSMSRAIMRHSLDLFFFPAVYSYFPLFSRVPVLVTFHDTIVDRFPEMMFPTARNRILWRIKCRLAALQARRLMTVSEASARDLVAFGYIDEDRIDIVSEAASPRFTRVDDVSRLAAVRARYGVPTDAALLVYVGGLNPHKNLLGLLRGMILATAKHPELHLAIIGDTSGAGFHDNADELQAFVRSEPALERVVHFTGYVSDADLVALYNTATALAFPSLCEGFGLPAVEAMACGLPVLTSRRGSLPEVVGSAGLLFDPESPDEIAAAIHQILDDQPLRERLRARAIERAATYSWDRGAELAELSFARCLGEQT